jgi:hypothetical protein
MALFIPYRCPKYLESVTLILPQHREGGLKGPAKGQCPNCIDEKEYDLTVPVNRRNCYGYLQAHSIYKSPSEI